MRITGQFPKLVENHAGFRQHSLVEPLFVQAFIRRPQPWQVSVRVLLDQGLVVVHSLPEPPGGKMVLGLLLKGFGTQDFGAAALFFLFLSHGPYKCNFCGQPVNYPK